MRRDDQIWKEMNDDLDKYGALCPVCLCGIRPEDKAKHMEDEHGYETLELGRREE